MVAALGAWDQSAYKRTTVEGYSPAMRVTGSDKVMKFLTEDIEEITGGKFTFEDDPVEAAHLMIRHIDKKRAALKLKPMMYETPLKPE